ncbi:MAG: efflux RND transporter periplasmic adaptor subunit [Bacteroidales bacterium]|nr:efflux RND transporter periplasmic adaptor subunit [Bacteroidales bacterium]
MTKLMRVARWLAHSIPPLVIFTTLGGLLYWGHHTGWAFPSFATVSGRQPAAEPAWCGEHSIPEEECVECNPALMPRPQSFGWCKEHGVRNCPTCHPELAQTRAPVQVTDVDRARAARALSVQERPENNPLCKIPDRRIQFASVESVEKAGVDVEPVWTSRMVETVPANGEIQYDPTQLARLSTRGPGTMFRVFKNVGDHVSAGEVVAIVDAAAVGEAKAALLQAIVSYRLQGRVLANLQQSAGAVPQQRIAEAESALSEAGIRVVTARQTLINLGLPIRASVLDNTATEQLANELHFLGLPTSLVTEFHTESTSTNLLPITAPQDGVVIQRDVVPGEVVSSGQTLFVIAEPAKMWLTLDIRQEDVGQLKIGQTIRFQPNGNSRTVSSTLAWISSDVDHKTRTVKVRASVDNANGLLRANTFGRGQVVLRDEPEAVVVPKDAVHFEGCCRVVFVRDKDFLKPGSPKVFHTRSVRVGTSDGRNTEIIAGVLPGELVAVKGSGTLQAELLRGKLGEG